MVEQTESLVLEILRRIQSDIAEIKNDIKDLKAGQIDPHSARHHAESYIRAGCANSVSAARTNNERTVAAFQADRPGCASTCERREN